MKAEVAVRTRARTGEGPVWLGDSLLWVDIPSRQAHRYDPRTGADDVRTFDVEVTAVVPRASGGLVAAVRDGFALLDVDAGSLEPLATVDPHPATRFNDGKCSPDGRFFAGTMAYDFGTSPESGSLYRLDADGSVQRVFDRIGISNGLGWSPDGSRMYFIDTLTGRVDVCDYADGEATGRRPFVPVEGGAPDGMAMDEDGCLWVALWGGWCVQRYSPAGEPLERVELPAAQVTSCAFGGPDLQDLYVTTAADGLPEDEQPLAGSLFVCRPGVRGLPADAWAG